MASRLTLMFRMTSLILVAAVIASAPIAAQSPLVVHSRKSGEAHTEVAGCPGSPMVLTVPFAATDHWLWEKGWFTTDDYDRLSQFSCGGVWFSGAVDSRGRTTESGLNLAVRKRKDGMVLVDARVRFYTPYGNKDQRVTVTLEVLQGDKVARRATINRLDVEEGHTPQHGSTSLLFYPEELQVPLTLRLTVWVTKG